MYSILVCVNQISNVILPQNFKNPAAATLDGNDYLDRKNEYGNNKIETKGDENEDSTGPLKINFSMSITNAMNQDTPFQRSTDLIVNQHFSNHDAAEFLSMRNCTASSYAFPLLNDAKISLRFNGIIDSQALIIQLCDEDRCLAVATVRIESLFENDDILQRFHEADDMIKLEKPFDVFLHCEEDSTVVCRMRGELHILISPLQRRFSPSDSIFESALPYIWIVHTLLLLLLAKLLYESALRGIGDRITLSISPQNVYGLPDLTEAASVSVPATVGPLQLRRGMSMLQGDVLAGCVGFHSALCLPTYLTLDGKCIFLNAEINSITVLHTSDSGSLLLFSWRDYKDSSQRFVLRWNSSDYVDTTLPYQQPYQHDLQPSAKETQPVTVPAAVSQPQPKNLGDWLKSLLHIHRRTTEEPPPPTPPPQEEEGDR